MEPTRLTSTDGTALAVFETGVAGAPTVVLVHGYPDDHAVWDGVTRRLADRFHVVAYDVRGAGASDRPGLLRAYRMTQLVDDLITVLDGVDPDSPVHLVGHDWGSIQSWAAVTDARLDGRIATYTSISGPSLDYAAAWLRGSARHPLAAARQLAHSYYVGLFQLPRLPELAIRRGLLDRALPSATPRSRGDQLAGLQLYRANVAGRLRRPRPVPAGLPVQLVVPERDAYVTPELAIGAATPWVADLTVHRIPAGHWVMAEQPELIAGLVTNFAALAPR